jgi:hypothetical protein
MAHSTRMSMQKRMREQKKAEKAALKRDQKRDPKKDERGNDVASADDLADYGAAPAPFSDSSRD